MKTKYKLASSLLATTLLITPINIILNENSNAIFAKEETNKHKVLGREYMSTKDTKKLINILYEEKLISLDKKIELEEMLKDKSFWGTPYYEYFSDGARDLHIPGCFVAPVVIAGYTAVVALLKKLPSQFPALANTLGAANSSGVGKIAEFISTTVSYDAIKKGIVIYYVNPHRGLVCAGGNCYEDTIYDYHHIRLDD